MCEEAELGGMPSNAALFHSIVVESPGLGSPFCRNELKNPKSSQPWIGAYQSGGEMCLGLG